jgi:hypothetical protein
MKNFFKMISLIAVLSLFACATNRPSPYEPVYLTNLAQFVLLAPDNIEEALDLAQHITAVYNGQEYVMDAWLKADAVSIDIALFSAFGTDMGALLFNRDGVTFSSPVLPSSLKPEYIVADIQLCFYRVDALTSALADIGLTLTVTNAGAEERRVVLDKSKKTIIEIVKTQDCIQYTNHLRNYAYTLRGNW